MTKPQIPKFLYEKLPLLYVIAGVAGLYFAGRHLLGLIGSLTILAAAGTIWFMRRNHRFGLSRENRLQRIRAFKLRQEQCDRDDIYRNCQQCDPEFSRHCNRPWAVKKQKQAKTA